MEIKGKDLTRAYTLNTMYADNKVQVEDENGTEYRIDVSEILKMMKRRKFTAEKKRKYYHLTLV